MITERMPAAQYKQTDKSDKDKKSSRTSSVKANKVEDIVAGLKEKVVEGIVIIAGKVVRLVSAANPERKSVVPDES